jgi:hypothetical protein
MGVYSGSGEGSFTFFGIIHNAATFIRDIEIAYRHAPEIIKIIGRPRFSIIGGGDQFYTFENKLVLTDMMPGENRWISITIPAPRTRVSKVVPVIFEEMVDNTVINGFAIALRPDPLFKTMLENLRFHSHNFLRLESAFQIRGAYKEGMKARELGLREKIEETQYMEFLQEHAEITAQLILELLQNQQKRLGDSFHIEKTLKAFMMAVKSKDAQSTVPLHSTLLHKLDAYMTMIQKEKGDAADILQNVRWQKELVMKIKQLQNFDFTHELIKQFSIFIKEYGARNVDNDDYPGLISGLMDTFQKIATIAQMADASLNFEAELEGMKNNLRNPTALQKTHRDYLLKLQTLVK